MKSIVSALTVLLASNIAFAGSAKVDCTITRVALNQSSVAKDAVAKTAAFVPSAAGDKLSVVLDSALMPNYELRFDLTTDQYSDTVTLSTVRKATGEVMATYNSTSIFMEFVSGDGICYKIRPNNSFLSDDQNFVFDIGCGMRLVD